MNKDFERLGLICCGGIMFGFALFMFITEKFYDIGIGSLLVAILSFYFAFNNDANCEGGEDEI